MTGLGDWFDLHNDGNALLELGLADDAIIALQQSIRLNPEIALSYRALGDAYICKNELQKAQDCFMKAFDLRILADGTPFLFSFFADGVEYDEAGKYDQALIYYTMAIKENTERPIPYLTRGIVYANQERFDEALADFNEAIRLDPCVYQGYYDRGLCLIEMGRYHEAADDLSYALKLEPLENEILLEYAEAIAILRWLEDA